MLPAVCTGSPHSKYAWALAFLSSPARSSLEALCRKYAAGLRKYEPGDLYEIQIPVPKTFEGAADLYSKAISLLASNELSRAVRIADEFIEL